MAELIFYLLFTAAVTYVISIDKSEENNQDYDNGNNADKYHL